MQKMLGEDLFIFYVRYFICHMTFLFKERPYVGYLIKVDERQLVFLLQFSTG